MGRLLYENELSKVHNTFLLFEGDTEEGIAGKANSSLKKQETEEEVRELLV
jgi:hypothetical protein